MPKSVNFRIRYHRVEGDVREVLTELVHEKIRCALSANGQYRYYGVAIPVSNYITYQGEVGNEQGSDLRSCQHEESNTEG